MDVFSHFHGDWESFREPNWPLGLASLDKPDACQCWVPRRDPMRSVWARLLRRRSDRCTSCTSRATRAAQATSARTSWRPKAAWRGGRVGRQVPGAVTARSPSAGATWRPPAHRSRRRSGGASSASCGRAWGSSSWTETSLLGRSGGVFLGAFGIHAKCLKAVPPIPTARWQCDARRHSVPAREQERSVRHACHMSCGCQGGLLYIVQCHCPHRREGSRMRRRRDATLEAASAGLCG